MFFRKIKSFFLKGKIDSGGKSDIDPDEIFLDSKNLPDFDVYQFEGRLEKPISQKTLLFLFLGFFLIGGIFIFKLWNLEVKSGAAYAELSEKNRLKQTVQFSERGVIYDRNGEMLAWNTVNPETSDYPLRKYIDKPGFSNLLGYVKYPSKDKSGNYYQENYVGKDGVEKKFDSVLSGENGMKITETDALGKVQSESMTKPPVPGENLTLSVDLKLQAKLYEFISKTAASEGYTGGAGAIMDVNTGEVIALTTYPEYSSDAMSSGDSKLVGQYLSNKNNPFLNRAISGYYTPGSIIKPFLASGALNEGVIDPAKKILSTGSISIPNPYFKDQPSVFKDWRAQGWVDMRKALAVSSDVYFYEIGGGFQDQKGLGIYNIDKYARMFGFGSDTGVNLDPEVSGVIPNPEWKKENFNGEDWRIGDTYHTSIGQYGFQVTPIQAVRAVASVANGGKLFTPTVLKNQDSDAPATSSSQKNSYQEVGIPDNYLAVVREGMRMGVLEGTASGLNVPYVAVAGKTGTAELGLAKQYVNSWATGFFPYENPKYAFAVLMEKGSVHNTIGGVYVMRQLFDWMSGNLPDYFK